MGNRTTRSYDSVSNLILFMDPNSSPTAYDSDGMGRRTGSLDACGIRSTLTYSCRGDLLLQIDVQGRTMTNICDALGRPIRQTDACGAVTSTLFKLLYAGLTVVL